MFFAEPGVDFAGCYEYKAGELTNQEEGSCKGLTHISVDIFGMDWIFDEENEENA